MNVRTWLAHIRRPSRRLGGVFGVRCSVFGRALNLVVALGALGALGCRQDMHDQPRLEPLQESAFFADGRASRPLVEGTVPRGYLREDTPLYTGKMDGKPIATNPLPLTPELLARGQERFNIFCTPCHDRVGGGNGIVVQRGFRRPESYHTERLRAAPDGYFFDVMTNGFGTMLDYRERITPPDRWAIVAYVRALQLSQNALLSELPPEIQSELQGGGG